MSASTTMRVFIPLTIRKRNGRPKIVPPADLVPDTGGGIDPHVLKAVARAWSWRRKLESGAVSTLSDIAEAEGVTPAFIRRTMKLAYLAPAVLEQILIARRSPSVSLKDMSAIAEQPWVVQKGIVFSAE
ncbi:hypothetical protein FHS51_003439 [Sphingobium wenxiniae]|uniref:Bacteriophage-related protein n=1 Tax=Sphingobium wenxiniae (strain DSM 21828 / CGMCC 1.7748 / JZ-1) TaxID=595605 RepID=A0A562KMU1_SPHWJ|nr:hypothetical protein [Sphingobium wenxiniae]MBB6193183.1 hypothetical protein [Sphingobium wenxiniae]TWH96758.1 hypothetical protein IQ35_00689 [Sphingobium wenxiniae]